MAEQPPFLPPIAGNPAMKSCDVLPENYWFGLCEVSAVQGTLRAYGQPLFDALANPGTVGEILKAPASRLYHPPAFTTDTLISQGAIP